MKNLLIFLACFSLFSCKVKDVSYLYPDNPDYARKSRAGKAFSENDLVIYGKTKKPAKENLAANYSEKSKENPGAKSDLNSGAKSLALWKSSIEVISALFPIEILDKDSGAIISSWYQEKPESQERVKISAIVKGEEIKPENLRITVYRQRKFDDKNKNSTWKDQSKEDSDQGALSAKLLQEKILETAKKKQ